MGKVCMPRGARAPHGNFDGKGFAAAGLHATCRLTGTRRRSPCCKPLSVLADPRRAASACRSKACHGKRPCRDGNEMSDEGHLEEVIMGEYDGAGQET